MILKHLRRAFSFKNAPTGPNSNPANNLRFKVFLFRQT